MSYVEIDNAFDYVVPNYSDELLLRIHRVIYHMIFKNYFPFITNPDKALEITETIAEKFQRLVANGVCDINSNYYILELCIVEVVRLKILEEIAWINLSNTHITKLSPNIKWLKYVKAFSLNNIPIIDPANSLSVLFRSLSLSQRYHITILRLSNIGLETIPEEIVSMEKLIELNVSKNPLSILPPQLGHLPQLNELDIHDTNIDISDIFFGFKKLERLVLYNTPLLALVKNHNPELDKPPLDTIREILIKQRKDYLINYLFISLNCPEPVVRSVVNQIRL